jgi:hypothetical protein
VILAVVATKITTRRSYREGPGAGIKMKEWLFFYWINMIGAGKSIDKGKERTVFILPHPAEASFPIIDLAVMATQETMYLLIFQLFVKEGFFHVILPPKTMVFNNKLLALSGQLSEMNIVNRQSSIVNRT